MNPNKALWEKGDFTRIAASMRESGEALVGTLGIKNGLKVLDLGCGDGTTALPAAKLGADVLGVDIARNLVEAGNRRAQEQGLTNLRFQEGDATDLAGLQDKSFDLVVSFFGASRPEAVRCGQRERDERPDTYNWHFADVPFVSKQYVEGRDCQPDKAKGDCAVNELGRLKGELHCKTGAKQVEALKYAVHFVGDIHQPMHTVGDAKGANEIQVDIFMRGKTCLGTCKPDHMPKNLHAAWDSELIKKVVWDWGAYVDRLEEGEGWLKSQEAQKSGIDGGTPAEWAEETHRFARQVWELLPADNVLGDAYLRDALPIMDRQLGVAGLRLARLLNEAYTSDAPACQPHQP